MARPKRTPQSQDKKPTSPAGHTRPGKRQLNLTVSEVTIERLAYLRHRRAARTAEELGRTENPDRLGAPIIEELIYQEWVREKEREAGPNSR